MPRRLLEFAPGLHAHCSGALWLPAEKSVIVADAHLGYGWAQRRRGELGPVVDGGARASLDALVEELHPSRVVFLGDTVHAPKPCAEERALIEETLAAMAQRAAVTVIPGNHDRAFRRDFSRLGFATVPQLSIGRLTATHGDRLPEEWDGVLTVGHLHPSLRLRDAAGASRPYRVFLHKPRVLVLPAFSPFAAGCDVRRLLPPEWRALLGEGPVWVVGVTGTSVASLRSVSL